VLHLGTTGAPKGVTYTHRSSFLHTLRMLQVDVHGHRARDSVLAACRCSTPTRGAAVRAPAAGARLVLPGRRWTAAHLASLIASEGVTVAVGVPDDLARSRRARRAHRRRRCRRSSGSSSADRRWRPR
jgi:fatty-acyl-CoA synthase